MISSTLSRRLLLTSGAAAGASLLAAPAWPQAKTEEITYLFPAPPILPAFPLPGDGFVLRETGSGWRDEQHTAYAGSGQDRPVKSDPVLAFALGPNGTGWAVGGWSGEQDTAGNGSSARSANGRADRTRVQTAAVFRDGDEGQPPPGAAQAPVPLPAGPARFAVAGHAACEMPCVDLALQDIRPDRSLASAL